MPSVSRDFPFADPSGLFAVYKFSEPSENSTAWVLVFMLFVAFLLWPAQLYSASFHHTTPDTAIPGEAARDRSRADAKLSFHSPASANY